MKSISTKIIYSIAFAVIVYLALSIWGLRGGLSSAFSQFNWYYLPLLLVLSLANYLLRFLKWQYYLKILNIQIPVKESFNIHMAGLGLSITPGKLGEVVKSYFLKKGFNQPVSKTAPLVFADRLTDMAALIIMTAIGAIGFSYGQKVIWVITAFVVMILIIVIIRPLGEGVLNLLCKIKFLNRRSQKLFNLYESSYALLKPSKIILPIVISLLSWSCEALELYLVFISFGLTGFLAPYFIYSFSTVVGAVSMLPGGLGVTEGAIAGLMQLLNISVGISTLATLIIRATTLWFAVIVGLFYLLLAERKYGDQQRYAKNDLSSSY